MKTAIFTMGLPGSGKSTLVNESRVFKNYKVIDPDEYKKMHPRYNPKNPSELHEWSKRVTELEIQKRTIEGENIIIDGTGTNAEKMVKRINQLKDIGYRVIVIYVKVKLETALYRNRMRERSVKESLIYEKSELIETSYNIVKKFAKVIVINND